MRVRSLDELGDLVGSSAPRAPGDAALWVLVPSAALVHRLEQTILERGVACAGVLIATPKQMVRRVLMDHGLVPRPEASRSALAAWLADAVANAAREQPLFAGSDLAYLGRFAGARRSLLRTLLDARTWQAAYGVPVRPRSARGRASLSFLPALADALDRSGLDDRAARLSRAIHALRSPHPADPGRVLVLGEVATDAPERIGLLRGLGDRAPVQVVGRSGSRRSVFDRSDTSSSRPELRLFSAQGEEAELTEAAQRARDLIASGVPAHEIAIVPVQAGAYEHLAEPVAARESVPLVTRPTGPLAGDPAAALAVRIVRLCCEDSPRRLLLGVLGDPEFGHEDLTGEDDAGDGDAWRQAIGALDYVTRSDQCLGGEAEVLDTIDRVVQAAARSMSERAGALRRARRPLARWLGDLRQARGALAAARSAGRQADVLSDLLRRRLRPGEGHEGVRGVLLAQIDRIRERSLLGCGPLRVEELPAAVEELLGEAVVPRTSTTPDGVAVVPLDGFRGDRYEHVFLLGMNRDRLPRGARSHPHLTAADLRAIRADLEPARTVLPDELRKAMPLPLLPEDENALARASLDAAVAATGACLTVSFLRANAQGQPKSPSPWLRHLARALGGAASLERMLGASDASVTVPWSPPERVAARLALGRPLSVHEARLQVAFAAGARALDAWIGRREPECAPSSAAATEWLEARDSFLTRGGDALRFDALGLGKNAFLARGTPVSAFAELGDCPLQFWLVRTLGVEPLPPEPSPERISYRDLGIAIHDVMHRVLAALGREGRLGPENDPNEAADRICEAAGRELDRRESSLLTSQARRLPLLRDRVVRTWRETLDRVLRLDLADLAATGFRPIAFEQEIDRGLPLESAPGIHVPMHGRIDRVDRARSGRLRILDYKTGGRFDPETREISAAPFKGRSLQLPIYALLCAKDGEPPPLAELRGVAPDQLAAFDDELPRRMLSPRIWHERAGLEETVLVLAALLAAGDYPFRKGPQCRWCDFRSACARNHAPSIERLARVERLAGFARLGEKSTRKPTLGSLGRHATGGAS